MRLWVLRSCENCNTVQCSVGFSHPLFVTPCPSPVGLRDSWISSTQQGTDRSALVSTGWEGAGEWAGGRPCLYSHRNQKGGWNHTPLFPCSLPLSPRASHQCLGSSRWMLLSVPSHGGWGINSLAGPLGPAKAGAMPPLLLYLFPGVKWWVQLLPPSPHHPNLSSHGEAPANWPSIPAVAHNPSWSFTLLWAARESHCNGSSLPNARFFLTCSFSTVSLFPSTAIDLLSSIKHWWKDKSERDTDLWSSVETNHKEERNWEKKA